VSQDEGQRRNRPHSRNLPQQPGLLRVAFLADSLYAPLVVPDSLGQRADGLNHVFEGFGEFGGQHIGDLFVEALGGARGQTSPEGLDRPPDVVDQLRASADQRVPGADEGQMSLGLLAAMLDGI
jgi:hypothetical protein